MSHILKGGLLASTLLASAASATTLEITVVNEQAGGGLYLTPLLSIFHDGTYDSFDAGSNATAGVELLAEQGDASGVIADVNAANPNHATTVIANPGGFGGAPVLDPGEVTTIQIDLDVASQRFFSFLSMVIPSNDTFIGNDSATAYELFNLEGEFVLNSPIEIFAGDAWNAGTELDDGLGAPFTGPNGPDGDSTETSDPIAALDTLDFLIGRPQAPGGTVQSASGLLASITFSEVAPVPLPAGLPLLLGGLGMIGFLRRKKAS